MSDDRKTSPQFHIMQPNPLLHNRVFMVWNPDMCRSVCDLIESLADEDSLTKEQQHIYAFAKRLRAHFFAMKEMHEDKENGKSFSSRKTEPLIEAGFQDPKI